MLEDKPGAIFWRQPFSSPQLRAIGNCVANRFVIAGEVASLQWAGGRSVRAGRKPDAFRLKGVASIEQPLRLADGVETDIVALRINALLQPVNTMCQCDIRTLEQINTAL